MSVTCHEHSGCLADISNLKESNKELWEAMSDMRRKYDGVMIRLNTLIGMVAVAILGAVIQQWVKN